MAQRYVAAVSTSDGCKLLLDDSGACENVAKNGDFRAPTDGSKAKPLFSVQGTLLKVYGKQYTMQVGSRHGTMEMAVADAAESLLSENSMTEKGNEVHFTKNESYVVMFNGETMPLENHGKRLKRWYRRVGQVRSCETGARNGRIAPVGPEHDEDKD